MNLSIRTILPAAAAAVLALGFAAPAHSQGTFEQNLAKAQKTLNDINTLTTRVLDRNAVGTPATLQGTRSTRTTTRSSTTAGTANRNTNGNANGNTNRTRRRRPNPNPNPVRKNP
jgi:hypothetical protein